MLAAESVVATAEDMGGWLVAIVVGMAMAVAERWPLVAMLIAATAIAGMAIAGMAGERSHWEVPPITGVGVTVGRTDTTTAHARATIRMLGGRIGVLITEVLGSIEVVDIIEALGLHITGAVTEALGFPTIGVVATEADAVGGNGSPPDRLAPP